MSKVAIITVNYNRKKDTLEFLDSLTKLLTAPSGGRYQLLTIVVDNASTDSSVAAIKIQYPNVDILQTGANLGFAGGYNSGIEYAKIWGADYFLLINNDCLFKDENLVDELIKILESEPKIGIVSPKILFAPGFEFHKDRYSRDEVGKVIWYGGGYFDWDNIGSVHKGLDEVDNGEYDAIEETDLVSGACMFVRKEVFASIGGFDEKYFLYFEDSDFQNRVTDSGFEKYYCGTVAIYHKVSQTAGIGSPLTDYYHARNRLILGFRYGSIRTKFALLREALKLFLFGRPAQRRGILDFYLGARGRCDLNQGATSTKVRPQQTEYLLKLSICIVSYNTADLTKKLLQSIFEKDSGFYQNNMEVIVLDNGSDDKCREVIKGYLTKIKYIQNKENEGFSKGYNKLIRASKGEYFLMLNSDIELMKGSITEMVRWAKKFEGEAILGGRLYFPDGSNQDSCFHLPTIWGAFKEYFLGKKGSYFMYLPRNDKPSKVEGLVMACFLIPKKILNLVGLLDEGTFIFFEDIEYARRLKKFGVPIYFVPTACFIHHHGAATKRIGQEEANELLRKSALHYHGKMYYKLLTSVLWLGQKFGRVKTPISRWINE